MPLKKQKSGRFPYGTISTDDLLSGLDRCYCDALGSISQHLTVPPGHIIFAAADQTSRIFIHRSGKALIFGSDGITHAINACPISKDCVYGLIEALSGDTFNISVKTVTSCEFDVIGSDDFFDFVRKQPDLCFRLAVTLSRLFQAKLQTIKSH